jgi:Flp pilus assembly protein TadB
MDSRARKIMMDVPKHGSQAMSPPSEQGRDAGQAASKTSRRRKFWLLALAALLGTGILLRFAGVPLPAWILVVAGAALAFVFMLPAIGGRMQEPEDSPFKKVPWGG